MSSESNSIILCEIHSEDLNSCNKNTVATTKGESLAISSMLTVDASEEPKQTNVTADIVDGGRSNVLLKLPTGKRERRNVSPCLNVSDTFPDPVSPSSSSSTSQATSANDATFEPTIEMMVNDFDDEQTLNEEEALAALESQDPVEEINTLKEESEMPLEELLAKYQALAPMPFIEPPRKKPKKLNKKKHKPKSKPAITLNEELGLVCPTVAEAQLEKAASDAGDRRSNHVKSGDEKDIPDDEDEELLVLKPASQLHEEIKAAELSEKRVIGNEIIKVRRTHLLELYPEGTFDNAAVVAETVASNGKDIPLETLYGVDDEEDEEDEDDEDYKKKVMIGPSYQAIIPHGLSQYGDILPYENEDKLIWEPSQVSEREVEEYLLKIRDIKSNQGGEDETADGADNVSGAVKTNCHDGTDKDNMENNSLLANGDRTNPLSAGGMQTMGNVDFEGQIAVVKDNEQALHLLVQCGYDFKEALRRKRLNALPLNDCMSLWSEEECQKFEEGIQKFGKDFLKIRQNQVRTRTMRELVQFYYLWKKSERRDHNFANADTVDHMDIYLNEDNEYGSNPASVATSIGSPIGHTATTSVTRRNSCNSQKNVSIMSSTGTITNNSCTPLLISLEKVGTSSQHQKRRASNSLVIHTEVSNSDNSLSTTPLQTTSSTISPTK